MYTPSIATPPNRALIIKRKLLTILVLAMCGLMSGCVSPILWHTFNGLEERELPNAPNYPGDEEIHSMPERYTVLMGEFTFAKNINPVHAKAAQEALKKGLRKTLSSQRSITLISPRKLAKISKKNPKAAKAVTIADGNITSVKYKRHLRPDKGYRYDAIRVSGRLTFYHPDRKNNPISTIPFSKEYNVQIPERGSGHIVPKIAPRSEIVSYIRQAIKKVYRDTKILGTLDVTFLSRFYIIKAMQNDKVRLVRFAANTASGTAPDTVVEFYRNTSPPESTTFDNSDSGFIGYGKVFVVGGGVSWISVNSQEVFNSISKGDYAVPRRYPSFLTSIAMQASNQ